jgi:hypothetical protein
MEKRVAHVEVAKKARGYRWGPALPELLSCLVIVLLVIPVASPAIAKRFLSRQAATVEQLVAEDLRHAATLASELGTPVRVEFDPESLEVRLLDRRFGTVLHSRRIGPGTEFPLTSATASGPVDVYPNHKASMPLVITVVTPDRSARVMMNRAAEVKIEDL